MAFLAPMFAGLSAAGAAGAAAVPVVGAAGPMAVPTFLAGAGGGLSALSILQGTASVMSALGSLSAGNAQASAAEAQATQADLDAEREANLGMQRRTKIKSELLQVLGENDVAAAAAGIDVGTGLATDMAASLETRAAQELSIDRADQDYRAAQKRAQAAGYRSQARSYRRAGALNAAGAVLSSGLSMGARG